MSAFHFKTTIKVHQSQAVQAKKMAIALPSFVAAFDRRGVSDRSAALLET